MLSESQTQTSYEELTGAPLMTIADVMGAANISRPTVTRAIASGELEATKVRTCVRIEPRAYRQWIDGGRTRETDAA